jgi:triacylglycerol lipase
VSSRGRAARIAAAAFAVALILLAPTGAAAQGGSGSPGIDPPGANDFSCKPPPEHPRPVVLVHGTYGDMTMFWNLISPALAEAGYCVFALDYGDRATGPIQRSARELRAFVRRVLEATDARKVAIIGHSQGGMMPRWYIKFLGGSDEVAELIGLSPSNHGTTIAPAEWARDSGDCAACAQQIAGSRFLRRLNRGDETPGRVSYTQIQTKYDQIVVPYESAFLEPGPRTTNVLLQERCPGDLTEHISITYDPVALDWIENALGRRGPADRGFEPSCSPLPA